MSYNLVVNSMSRSSTSASSSNFTVNLNNNINVNTNGYKYIKLSYLGMYNTIYNVDTTNQNIDIKIASSTYTATVPIGSYNANTLASALQTVMTSVVSNSWNVSYSSTTFQFTITGTSSFQLLFNSGTHSANLWQVMGFASSNGLTPIDTTSGTSTTSTQVAQLTKPIFIYINFASIPACFKYASDQVDSYSFVVPCNVEAGSLIEYSEYSSFPQYIRIANYINVISSISVSLGYRNSASLSLNGSEWWFVLEFVKEIIQE